MGLWVLAHNEIDAMCCDDDDPFFGFVREDRGSHNDSARVDSAVASYLLGDDVYHDFLLAGYVICCKVIGIRFSETYIKRETEAQVFYDEDNVNIFGTAYFWVELRRPVSLVSYTGCPLGISASLPISQLPPTLQSYDDGSVNDRGMSFWKRKIEASLQNITGGVEMIPWFGGSTRSTECPERAICAFARHLGVYGCTDPYVLAVDIVLSVFDLRDDDAMGPRLAELIRMPDEVMAQAMGFPHPHCHIQRQLLAEAYVMVGCFRLRILECG